MTPRAQPGEGLPFWCAEPASVEFTSTGVRATFNVSGVPQLPPDACALLLADATLRTLLARAYGSEHSCRPLQKNVLVLRSWAGTVLTVDGRLWKTGRRLAMGEARITTDGQFAAEVTATYRRSSLLA